MLHTTGSAKPLQKHNLLYRNTTRRPAGSPYLLGTLQAGTSEQPEGSTLCRENHFNASSSILPVEAEEVGWGLKKLAWPLVVE